MEPLLKIWLPLARWPRLWLKVIDARERVIRKYNWVCWIVRLRALFCLSEVSIKLLSRAVNEIIWSCVYIT